MQQKYQRHLFTRICIVLVLVTFGSGTLIITFRAGASLVSFQSVEEWKGTFTSTSVVYLPFISNERLCAEPSSGTVKIAGQATVHGRPAQLGVPFTLFYRHIEYPPSIVATATTRSDGSFCFEPVPVLPYCHWIWYGVSFQYISGTMPEDDYAPGWSTNVYACKPGQVYTVNAEIGNK